MDDWTRHLHTYVEQLRADGLMPPINSLQVQGDDAHPLLVVTVAQEPTSEVRDRIDAVLRSVPYQIRHQPLSDDGRRPGVGYA